MYNFELFQRKYFNPLQKDCTIISSPLQAGLQNILTSLTCRPPVDPLLLDYKRTNPDSLCFSRLLNGILGVETTPKISVTTKGMTMNYDYNYFY